MASTNANDAAKALKALHVSKSPIVFTNVWDVASFDTVLSLNDGAADGSKPVKAVATASWAVAATEGVADEDLSWEQNLAAISRVAPRCRAAGLPLSSDLQDGYGARIEEVVTAAVRAGVSGANIEDSIPAAGFGKGIAGSLYPLDEQVRRLRAALKSAADAGCPDFVLNARCDVFCLDDVEDGSLDDATRLREAVARGKAFLEAGATTVFYWGGGRAGLSRESLQTLVKELDGRVAVLLSTYPGATVPELADLGVARISIGPTLFRVAKAAMLRAAKEILVDGGKMPKI
ncbi:C6 transcription factor [Purpureocillium lavendulum]|uniref:C6 transcription factor n=1 Tax=Purpureocillium lavendulum TaxID=1247861 RepID=A0AB34FGZ4_9HYPO|nr:C6 transcription factor [Purpureocillium lavendulum]